MDEMAEKIKSLKEEVSNQKLEITSPVADADKLKVGDLEAKDNSLRNYVKSDVKKK